MFQNIVKNGVLVAVVLGIFTGQAVATDTLLKCGAMLDVENKKFLKNTSIRVRDGVIAEIGENLRATGGAQLIDLTDRVCSPGLMDMHVHLFTQSARGTIGHLATTQSSAFNALEGMRFVQTLLNAGFTTIRIPGDFDYQYANIEIRNAINRGEYIGPRMFVAPHYISALGGHGDFNAYSPDGPHIEGPMIVDGAENLRRAVRKELKYGADWIKVMASGGVMSQHDDPEVAGYSDAEFVALAEETHRHKKKITAHAHGDAGIYAAVKAGFDSIEHATMMTERTAKLMAKKGTFYVPTFRVLDWILEMGASGGITANNYEKAQLVAQQHQRSAEMAYKHGVKMVIGSDSIFPMEEAILEFTSFAQRFPDTWYVMQAGTINPAEMLGKSDKLGSIAVGKYADIVAMPDNPIDNIKAVESIDFVMKGGRVIRGTDGR